MNVAKVYGTVVRALRPSPDLATARAATRNLARLIMQLEHRVEALEHRHGRISATPADRRVK